MVQLKKIILKVYNGKKFVTKYELAKILKSLFPDLFYGPTYLCDKHTYYTLAHIYINLCMIDKKPCKVVDKADKIIYHFNISFYEKK